MIAVLVVGAVCSIARKNVSRRDTHIESSRNTAYIAGAVWKTVPSMRFGGEHEMTQAEKRVFLIKELLHAQSRYPRMEIPQDENSQKEFLRALFNLREPGEASEKFLEIQNEYLQEELRQKGIIHYKALTPVQEGIYLWQGDITRLQCDAIVNAANCQLLGCFYPNHGCIDNAIHTFAGIQLRLACSRLMKKQGHEEEPGKAKITPAFNLPSKYVLHTVGPVIDGPLTQKDAELLASCYRACLSLAEQNGISSLAFCCISTGEYHFPPVKAAEIALRTVQAYKAQAHSKIEVIYNVFKKRDYEIYRDLLRSNSAV